MSLRFSWARLATAMALALPATGLRAQRPPQPPAPHDTSMRADTMSMTPGMSMMQDPLGIPMTRTGSGTTWLPERSPMHAKHLIAGSWELMFHGLAFVQYDKQGTDRGDSQFGAPNWGMLMASRPLGGGRLQLRGMMSLDPFTLTSRGYPLLLQSGEAYQGQPLHDRQHPHDLFMELAAIYEHRLGQNLALQLYLAPVGEPATGPVAFPHRPSASSDPLAPLGHHWQDATHISFGVATAALYTRTLKLEGSVFNGREPDEIRTNFDYAGRSLDSYAGRLTFNPNANVSVTGSYAYLKTPEGLHPELSQRRVTASALYGSTLGRKGEWSSALIYGANRESGEGERALSQSVLAESNLDLDGTNSLFGRVEFVQKSAADLAVDAAGLPGLGGRGLAQTSSDTRFNVESFVLGYMREISQFTGGSIGVGARGSINVIPSALEPAYGTRTPAGFSIFVRFRPNRMEMGSHSGMRMEMGAHEGGHGAAGAPPMSSMPGMPMPGMPRDSARAASDTAMRMNMTRRDTSMAGMAMPMTRGDSVRRDSARSRNMVGMQHPSDSASRVLPGMARMASMDTMPMKSMMALHQRMMADPVIRRRVLADTAMRRMMTDMIDHMPAEHRAMMQGAMAPMPSKALAPSKAKKPSRRSPKQPSDSTKKSTDHGKMPRMKMPPAR